MTSEPVAIGGSIIGLATAVIACLVGFEIVNWTEEQIGLVLAVVTAAVGVITATVRHFVVPASTVEEVDYPTGPPVP